MKYIQEYIDSQFCVSSVERVLLRKRSFGSKTDYIKDSDTNWIIYIRKGEIEYSVAGNKYQLKKNCLLFLPSLCTFSSIALSNLNVEYLLIGFNFANIDTNLSKLLEGGHIICEPNDDMKSIFSDLENSWKNKPIFYQVQTVYLVQLLIYNILCDKFKTPYIGDTYKRLENSLNYIHGNYDKRILVQDLASMTNICVSRYRDLFNKEFGISPKEYLQNLRLLHAKDLLYTNLSISEISSKCGYCGAHHLSRTFKKMYDLSPRNYQKEKINY